MGKLSFSAAVLMSINVMIGAGILYAVDPMTASSGSISFLGWPLIGLLLFPIIMGLAKASQVFPGQSGFYHYCSSGINPLAGFIAHWGYLLGYMGTAASLATVLRNGVINNLGMEIFQEYPLLFNAPLVLLYTLINMMDLSKISKIQSFGTLLKLSPLVIVVAVFAFYLHGGLEFKLSGLGNLGTSVSTVLFAFWGFETCCSLGSLLKDGPKKIASVMLVGFLVTMGLYFTFHLGLLYIMGPENLAAQGAISFPLYLGLSPFWQNLLQIGVAGAIMLSWANSILGVSLTNITNIYFLAENRLILGDRFLSALNRNERPVFVAAAHGIAFLAFITFVTSIDVLFALTSLGVITAFVLTLTSVFRVHLQQRKWKEIPLAIAGFASCAVLTYYSFAQIPSFYYALPLIIGMTGGIAIFLLKGPQAEKEVAL